MVAALLYLIGLITILASIAIAAADGPVVIASLSAAMDDGTGAVLGVIGRTLSGLSWMIAPLLTGLALMGFGRVIMLLSAINRSLRGQP